MHNLRHFYYQNKEKIWKIILLIAFILGLIFFLNNLARNEKNENNNISRDDFSIYANEQSQTYISKKSLFSNEEVTEEEIKKINSSISKFLQYCKNADYEQAYDMLSSDCKESKYNTLQKFKEKYINSKFSKDSIYEIEKWKNSTYKISISKDLLATGDAKNIQKQIEYITIVKENNIDKLNIDSFIEKKEINNEKTQEDIKITVVEKEIYMDYEIYSFTIENLSEKTIKLDSLNKSGTMYLQDTEGIKYNAYNNELLDEQLEIMGKQKVDITVKYAKTYSNSNNISKIAFENVILDYIKYIKGETNCITSISIDI